MNYKGSKKVKGAPDIEPMRIAIFYLMEQIGLRIHGVDDSGAEPRISWSAPGMSVWYPAVADLFRDRFWAADNFVSTPFNIVYEYSEEALEDLVVEWSPHKYHSGPVLFKPESMNKYYPFVHNDWVYLYGIQESQIPHVLSRWHDKQIDEFLRKLPECPVRLRRG